MSEATRQPGAAGKAVPEEILERFRAKIPKLEEIHSSLGVFHVRRPTGADQWELLKLQQELTQKGYTSMPPALILAACLRKADGELIWENANEGYVFLNTVDADALKDVFNEVLRVTGIGKRAMEIAEKKSSSNQSEDSGTSSPP